MSPKSSTHVLPPSAEPLRILVVDDDQDIADEVAAAFERAGCRVETAGSGMAARDLMGTRLYDVLLTDLRMPGGSGIELLDWVRTHRQTMRAFVMTGYADFGMEEAIRRGALGFFSKPFETRLIVDTVLKGATLRAALV